jgi:hypothetical protein
MRSTVCLKLLLVQSLQAVAKHRPPTPYPVSFQIAFATNLTDDAGADRTPVGGVLSYDWSQMAQRIDHGAGAYECQHFYGVETPCSLIFTISGMYRLIQPNLTTTPCCLDIPRLGPPPPEWATAGNGTFNGIVMDRISGLPAFQWTFDRLVYHPPANNNMFHIVREVALGDYAGRPLSFTFPSGGRQDHHFHVESMVIQPHDPSIFEIPDGCADLLCATSRTVDG